MNFERTMRLAEQLAFEEELMEMPYYHKDENAPLPAKVREIRDSTYSQESFSENYDKITEYKIHGNELVMGISKGKKNGYDIVAIWAVKQADSRLQVVSCVCLTKRVANRPKSLMNPIQVSHVDTREDFRTESLATRLYLEVFKLGYDIISDDEQYKGARGIWKALARSQVAYEAEVMVWDNRLGVYLKGTDGVQKYTGTNIPDSQIWNQDMFAYGVLIVLKHL